MAGGFRCTLCIDDFVLEEDVAEEQGDEVETPGDIFVATALELYTKLGIPPKPAKLNLKKRGVVFPVADVNGDSGRVGSPLRAISQVQMITLAAVLGAPVTKRGGQGILGQWTFMLLFRRELFALMFHRHRELSSMPDDGVARLFSVESRDELMSLILLALAMRTMMRWPVSKEMYATDAAGGGGSALVSAETTEEFAEELFRYSQLKGAYTTVAGDAEELGATSRAGAVALKEAEEAQKCEKRTEVEVYVPSADEEDEGFPAEKVGLEIIESRVARGLPVLAPPGLEEEVGKTEVVKWKTTMDEKQFRELQRVVSQRSLGLFLKLCLAPVPPEVRDLMEQVGDLPPYRYLQRNVLVWGALEETLRAHMSKVGWKLFAVEELLDTRIEGALNLVLEVVEHAVAEGSVGGMLVREQKPTWLTAVSEQVLRCGGFLIEWLDAETTETRRLEWKEVEEDQGCITADEKTWGMLKGWRPAEDDEDGGRFLEGRRGVANAKSLARAIEERHENVSAVREVKRRAWARSPWEEKLSGLLEVLEWKKVMAWRDPLRRNEHINVLETRAKRKLVQRIARRRRFFGKRYLHVTDSRVTEAVSGKGRSSAVNLNRELRLMIADYVGSDSAVPTYWGESSRMPADEPSRGTEVLEPTTGTVEEMEILSGRRPLLSKRVLREWKRGLWKPGPPTPLRRTRWGYRGVRVGGAKKPGPRASKVRSRSVPLEKTVSTNMAAQYARGFRSLNTYLRENELPCPERLAECHARTLDEALMRWVRFSHENEVSRDVVRNGLLSFGQKYWRCRMLLKPT